MKNVVLAALVLSLCIACAAQKSVFEARFLRHKGTDKRSLATELGSLTFDDSGREIIFKDDAHDNIEIPYDSVSKVLFETTEHMRGMTPQAFLAGAIPLAGMIAGPSVARRHVKDYWVYVEYEKGQQAQKVLLQVPPDKSSAVVERAHGILGTKVVQAEYPQKGEQIDTNELPDHKEKDSLRVDKQDHPLPESNAEKATVVIACPGVRGGYNGRSIQFKVHANDKIIAVNKWGTYDFAYLDPGKYRLVSQSENAYGFDMELEAGKSYYFLQNTFEGVLKNETSLTQNSPELVMYLVDGSYHSDWKPKTPQK